MRFSATRITTWMDCQLKAKFQYEDKLEPTRTHAKAVFGLCVHRALEAHDKAHGDLALAERTFLEAWNKPETVTNKELFWPSHGRISYGGLRQKGLEGIRAYHERFRFDPPADIVALEHKFLVPFGDHELTGFVDKLEVRRSGKGAEVLRIVDHKTSTKRPTIAELALNVQFTIYDFASRQREFWVGDGRECEPIPNGEWRFETFADMPRRNIWHHFWTAAEFDAGGRDDLEFQRLYRALNEVEKAIERDVHVPNISADSCGICDYAEGPCPARIPTEEELREQEAAWL